MLAYYDSHFGPVPVKVTRVERNGQRWEIFATVTANRPKWGVDKAKSTPPIWPKGKKILSTERSIFPRDRVMLTENGNIAATVNYDPAVVYAAIIERERTKDHAHKGKSSKGARAKATQAEDRPTNYRWRTGFDKQA